MRLSKFLFATKKSGYFVAKSDINPCVINAQYAVRGEVPSKANEIAEEIHKNPKGHGYPFKQITECNIGNPQLFRQPPISYNRRVLSCVLNPELLKSKDMHEDVKKRAKRYLDEIISAGCYTHSLGIPSVRDSIANYTAQHDGVEAPNTNNIFLTEGASQGVHMIIQMLISSDKDGIMIPIPQYPLYSASVALNGGTIVPYYLDEDKGWQLSIDEAETSFDQAKKKGLKPRAIVVINPGNPTGAVLNADTIQKIIKFAVNNKLIIIADEVYRENIYKDGIKFLSFRKVLHEMGSKYDSACELVTLNSISKGFLGECGLRGGYMELHNLSPQFHEQLVKLKSIFLCSNSVGQMMVDMMVNPPVKDVAPETKKEYEKERADILNSLKKRAKIVTESLNKMKNINCQEVEGAMYAFPSVKLSDKVVKASGGKPDLFYCMEVLKNTGIVLVPGSGFKQREGTYHFRITTLIRPEEKLAEKMKELQEFNDKFHKKYE